jgi:hypothetical protein
MIDYNMIYVYVLLTLFFSVDASLTMLANPTHMSKGAMHRTKHLRERCGSVPVTYYYHSCRCMITST